MTKYLNTRDRILHILLFFFFCTIAQLLLPFSDPAYPVDGDIVILEETTCFIMVITRGNCEKKSHYKEHKFHISSIKCLSLVYVVKTKKESKMFMFAS